MVIGLDQKWVFIAFKAGDTYLGMKM